MSLKNGILSSASVEGSETRTERVGEGDTSPFAVDDADQELKQKSLPEEAVKIYI